METGANFVATGCPGCRLQIHGNLADESIEVVHPVELLARAMP
jgi:Fe-S oxidoreductase